MIILGLTGSIGMGKTTAAADFRQFGVPVHDADAVVHTVLGPGGAAVAEVEALFPGSTSGAGIDRQHVGERVFGDREALAKLESLIHPHVRAAERRFLRTASRARAPLVVLDIPLLFETGGDRRCDSTAVVTAPARIQAQRVLSRPGMTRERFAAILAKQMPDAEKRRRAEFLIPTGQGRAVSHRRIARIVASLSCRSPFSWPPCPYYILRGNL